MPTWRAALAAGGCSLAPALAAAQPSAPSGTGEAERGGDAIAYRVHVDTLSRLFRRQTFPAPDGQLVAGGVAVPLYHYAMMRVDDVDAPWRRDSVDVEMAAWGNLDMGEPGDVGRIDGDLHILRVRQRFRYGSVSVGRQVQAGGAARFVRYDGVSAGARTPFGLGLDAYGGFTVLPRWSGRRGYHLLGSAADSLLRDPSALPDPQRDENWVAGTRAHYEEPGLVTAGLSFHEQRDDGGLVRRNAALDWQTTPLDELAWTGRAIVDLDATDLSDFRTSLDTYPLEAVTVRATYQHLTPSLLLSRQSVLSVFSTSAFDEWGLEGELRPWSFLRLGSEGYVERFEGGDMGARLGGHLRVVHEGAVTTVGRMAYRRVVESQNGYHSTRASVSLRPEPRMHVTADGFVYLYDEPIQQVSASIVGVLSAGFRATQYLGVTLASSLSRSPYATLDAQATARLTVDLEGGRR